MNRFDGKNILFIYYKFPPIKGIGTLRNVKFYRSLKKVARKVFVATTSNRHFLPRDTFQYEEKDVLEIPTFDFRTIYHYLTGDQGSLMVTQDKSPQKWLPLWKERFKKSMVARYFDEGGSVFVRSGFKRCSQLIEQEQIDVIISSYLPFDAHKLAYRLKKKYPHIYWVADYRDFFSDPMLRSSPGFNQRQEQHIKLLSLADEITTVSQGLKKRLKPFHPGVFVVRNGVSEVLEHPARVVKYKLFTISYTGSIYPEAQDGTLLAEALEELVSEGLIRKNHIQFMNAGKDGLYWKKLFEKYNLGDIVVHHGVIPHVEALAIQKKSHMNVLLSWASDDVSGILTGKLFEYLAAGPPIIAIVNGTFDPELDKLIAQTSRGAVFNRSDIGHINLKDYLLRHYGAWLEERDQPFSMYAPGREDTAGIITWQDEFDSWASGGHQDISDDFISINL